jgi:hemerythrin-like domain-containing protein
MTPIDLLREEHRVILGALDALERAAERGAAGGPVADAWWSAVVTWLRAFADRNHHAKEETALFPAMVKAGVPSESGGPIAVMLEEHVEGRRLVAAIESAAAAARVAACRDYVALLRGHIDKENGIVFPLAESVLDGQAMQGLRREFDAVEAEQGAAATLAGAEAALGRLRATLEGVA